MTHKDIIPHPCNVKHRAPVKQIQERKEISGRNELIASTGKGLIFLLQSQIKSILVKLYPVQPEQVTQEYATSFPTGQKAKGPSNGKNPPSSLRACTFHPETCCCSCRRDRCCSCCSYYLIVWRGNWGCLSEVTSCLLCPCLSYYCSLAVVVLLF